ncbi:uncharacterized protein B0H64DRAFT_462734 [Chaetomium fimeti]|uniref:Uncharacterized protein n=1 Tax=Chaetomium fimeti TaxID=1854472 RepID=A0AAE0LR26_9PEZI|nr:hypothetical protein B0H64DRAFT_462734 [Chaetomium fimeti]
MADRRNSHSATRPYHMSVESDVDTEGNTQSMGSRPVQSSDAQRGFKRADWNELDALARYFYFHIDRELSSLKGVRHVHVAGAPESPMAARPRPTKRDDTWGRSESSEPVRQHRTASNSRRPQGRRSDSMMSTYGLEVALLRPATPWSEKSRRTSVHRNPSATENDSPARYPDNTVRYPPETPDLFRAAPPPSAGYRSSRDDDRYRLEVDDDRYAYYGIYDSPYVRQPSTRSYEGGGLEYAERWRAQHGAPPGGKRVMMDVPERRRHRHAREPEPIIHDRDTSGSYYSGWSSSDETDGSITSTDWDRKRDTGRRMPSVKREDKQQKGWKKLWREMEGLARVKIQEEQRVAAEARQRATDERIMIEREVKERIESENRVAAEAKEAEAGRHEEFMRLMQAKLQQSVDEMVTMTKDSVLQSLRAEVMQHRDAEKKVQRSQRQAEIGSEADAELETKVASRREDAEQGGIGRQKAAMKSSQDSDTVFPTAESAPSIQHSGSHFSGATRYAPGRPRHRRPTSSEPCGSCSPRAPPPVPKPPSDGNNDYSQNENENENESESESERERQTSATSDFWTSHWHQTKEREKRKTLRMIKEELVNPIAEALAAGLAGRGYAGRPPMSPPSSAFYEDPRWHGERWRGRGSDPTTYDFNDREAESYRSGTERSLRGRSRSERWLSPSGWQGQRCLSPLEVRPSIEGWRDDREAPHPPPHGHTVGLSDTGNGAVKSHNQGLDVVRVDPMPSTAGAVGGGGVDNGTSDVQLTPQLEYESRGPLQLVESQANSPLRSENDSFIQANHHLAPTEVNSDALPDDLAKELVVPDFKTPPPAQPETRTMQRNVPDSGPESFRPERSDSGVDGHAQAPARRSSSTISHARLRRDYFQHGWLSDRGMSMASLELGAWKLLLPDPRSRRSGGVVGHGCRSVSRLIGAEKLSMAVSQSPPEPPLMHLGGVDGLPAANVRHESAGTDDSEDVMRAEEIEMAEIGGGLD